jgi:hypothetical protein
MTNFFLEDIARFLYRNGIVDDIDTVTEAESSLPAPVGKPPQHNFNKTVRALIKLKIIEKPNTTLKTLLEEMNEMIDEETPVSIDDIPPPNAGEDLEDYAARTIGKIKDLTLKDAQTFYTIYRGKLSQLKYEEESGRLILKSDVEQKAFVTARTTRDQLLAIPERISGAIVSMTDVSEVKETLYDEIIRVLEDLSASV